MSAPIEVTTRYATTLDDLSSAWAFVMDHVDRVGPDPSIKIAPLWIVSVHDMGDDDMPPTPRQFSVVVEGMVEADLLAARDRRVRAEALREAADNWPREVNVETIRREIATFDLRETPPEYRVDQWLRDRADRIEAER